MPGKTNQYVVEDMPLNRLRPDRKTIGIWDPVVTENGVLYKRNNTSPDAHNWSMVNIIPVKGKRKRLVLLGESVARGYLFDPYFNPAMCLEQLLQQTGAFDAEVIDLAKVSIGIEELTRLTRDCIETEPDAIIVFAGNNWFNSLRGAFPNDMIAGFEAIIDTDSNISTDGKSCLNNTVFEKIQSLIEAEMLGISTAYIDCLSAISAASKIPVIFIIPEFNLLDWKSTETERILFRLPDADLKDWLNCKKEAERLLAAGEYANAALMARRMIDTDGSHPQGYELLSQYYLNINDTEAAADCLEKARDTSMFCRSTGQARIYKIIQKALREIAPQKGISIVNLPQIFRDHLDGELPGRNLFVDYCHMSDRGIILAMTHTAQKILDLFAVGQGAHPVPAIDPAGIQVDNTIKAIAYLCASVHNAHYGQTQEIINYLSGIALGNASVVLEIAEWYADLATRKISSVLCKSHEAIIESEILIQYNRGKGFTSKPGFKLMDVELVDCLVAHLETKGIHIRDFITDLRIREHGINAEGVDLLKSFYKASSYDEYFGTLHPYYCSRNVVSDFYVVAADDAEACFKITCRIPGTQIPAEPIRILINGTEVEALEASLKWKNYKFSAKAGILKKGVNQLSIHWPVHTGNSDNTLSFAHNTTIDKLAAVFGDIHMLKACSC